jgi:hypothetical protein
MLTGRGLFRAETVSDVLGGVLKTEIDVGQPGTRLGAQVGERGSPHGGN